jgi:hypothetical protein
MDYEYDLFLSYRRGAPVGDWVRNHFLPELKNWLPLELGRPARIFVDDESIALGSSWPTALQNALRMSRCLLAVWSPDYFWHEWCVAEWQSMRERARRLDLRDPGTIVLPVVFHDGDNFPEEAKDTQSLDFRPHSIHVPAFAQTTRYVDFIEAVKRLCAHLAPCVKKAPLWQPDWPIVTPAAYTPPNAGLPKL